MLSLYLSKAYLFYALVRVIYFTSAGTVAMQGRIVNGTQANEGEFPFVVSLRGASFNRHSCGATLLNRAWVLTAAHCVYRAKPTSMNIQYGSLLLDQNSNKVMNVSKIFVHEGYEPQNQYIHDIALLKLLQPVQFDGKVRAVRLPEIESATPENSSAVLSGWGLNAVSLRRADNNAHFCAGTVISAGWVLTAAHCFHYNKRAEQILVQYGSIELSPHRPKLVPIHSIILHEGFSVTLGIHDIALIKLAKLIVIEVLAFFSNLPTVNSCSETEVLDLVGWGLNETVGQLQNLLQKVEVRSYANAKCQKVLKGPIYSTNLCVVPAAGSNKGHCSGDSGGPLLFNGVYQVGIISWSFKPCASSPGVFTRVASYTNWIRAHIK